MDELDDDSRRDLLVGREKRLREAYEDEGSAMFRRLDWITKATDSSRAGHLPTLTPARFDIELAATLVANAHRIETALRAWLVVRDELAALDKREGR